MNGNIVGNADAQMKLGALANNGGTTETISLLSGSPAIGAGESLDDVTTDQRGLPRKSTPDIGAYETQTISTAIAVADTGGTYNGSPNAATGTVKDANGNTIATPAFTYYVATDTSFANPLAAAPTMVGDYVVVANFAGDTNYSSSSTSNAFSITVATPTVTVTDAGGNFTGSPYAATATIAGVNGIDGSSLESVTPTLTYYSGSTTTGTPLTKVPTAVSTYTVVARFAGSADYTAVSSSTTFKITVTTAKVALSNLKQTYIGKAEFVTASTAPSGLAFTITYTQNGKAVLNPINAGSYGVTATTTPGYTGSTTSTLVIGKANPIITIRLKVSKHRQR